MSIHNIEHKGIVKEISNGKLIVNIDTVSACGGCHASSICSAFNTTQKEIEISNFNSELKIGDLVTIYFKEKYGFIAVFLGYILPFLILIITLTVSYKITNLEGFSGLISLSSLTIYYLSLYLAKNKIKKTFSFSAEKLI